MNVTVAALQGSFSDDRQANIQKVESLIRQAAQEGAQIILPPELFEGPYFCREEESDFFCHAQPYENHPTLAFFQELARTLRVVIPVSFFERDGPHYYNSLCVIDADGKKLGCYRKSHIPDGPGYEEKFYFRPGNTGFVTWKTQYATLGIGICWDQWFPECARALMLRGAEILFYPTAIGSEPGNPSLDTRDMWQKVMVGHAVANIVPVIAANRIGDEGGQIFYGSSFIANHFGEKVAELGRLEEGTLRATFDLKEIQKTRASFGFFRDRRPDLYGVLTQD